MTNRAEQVEEERSQIVTGGDEQEKIINKIKARLQIYKKWVGKLQVTKIIINERKKQFETNFKKISQVTGITNPDDVEGLIGFIEKAKDL